MANDGKSVDLSCRVWHLQTAGNQGVSGGWDSYLLFVIYIIENVCLFVRVKCQKYGTD